MSRNQGLNENAFWINQSNSWICLFLFVPGQFVQYQIFKLVGLVIWVFLFVSFRINLGIYQNNWLSTTIILRGIVCQSLRPWIDNHPLCTFSVWILSKDLHHLSNSRSIHTYSENLCNHRDVRFVSKYLYQIGNP